MDPLDFDALVRLAPQTALAIAADLPTVPARVVRPCTGLTEAELLTGYAVEVRP